MIVIESIFWSMENFYAPPFILVGNYRLPGLVEEHAPPCTSGQAARLHENLVGIARPAIAAPSPTRTHAREKDLSPIIFDNKQIIIEMIFANRISVIG